MPANDQASQTLLGQLYGWHVYVLFEVDGPYTKIGTAANVKYRVSTLRNGNARGLIIAKAWRVSSRLGAFCIERDALSAAGPSRVKGRDWVLLSHEQAIALVEQVAAARGIALEVVNS